MNNLTDFFLAIFDNIFSSFGIILPFLELVSLVISIILLWYIVFYVRKLNILKIKIEKGLDKYNLADVGKRRLRNSWLKVEKLIASGNIEKAQEAVVEADKILVELVKFKGVPGKNVNERIENLFDYQLEDSSGIKEARSVAKKIANKEILELGYQDYVKAIHEYREALKKISRMSF